MNRSTEDALAKVSAEAFTFARNIAIPGMTKRPGGPVTSIELDRPTLVALLAIAFDAGKTSVVHS